MTLFFYGAIALEDDVAALAQRMDELARKLDWKLNFAADKTLVEALSLPVERQYFIFELASSQDEVYDKLYGDYSGDKLEIYYRQIAKALHIISWQELEFLEDEMVNAVYEELPYPELPLKQFMLGLFQSYPQREIVIAIDQDFDNRFGCEDVYGEPESLVLRAWKTIAYGYSWPNLRLHCKQK